MIGNNTLFIAMKLVFNGRFSTRANLYPPSLHKNNLKCRVNKDRELNKQFNKIHQIKIVHIV